MKDELREMANMLMENKSRFYSLAQIAELLRRAADEIERLEQL